MKKLYPLFALLINAVMVGYLFGSLYLIRSYQKQITTEQKVISARLDGIGAIVACTNYGGKLVITDDTVTTTDQITRNNVTCSFDEGI